MKQIEIIPLALKKLNQRRIPEDWVKETVNYPDQIVEGYMGRKVRQKKYFLKEKEVLLRVIGEEKEDKFIVITVYLTSRIERYWR